MEGHRCSGWVYSSLFYVIMRIYSYPLLRNSGKYFSFMAVFGSRQAPKLSLLFGLSSQRRNAPCPSTTGLGVSCAQRQPQPSPRLKHSQYLQC